jgi:hypothetical protein
VKAIRYKVHFPSLVVSALVYWFATGYKVSIFGFDFFLFGLTGALHAASIVVALQTQDPE